MRPLVRCIGRALLVGRGPLVFGETLFMQYVVMSVEIAVVISGACLFVTVVFRFN